MTAVQDRGTANLFWTGAAMCTYEPRINMSSVQEIQVELLRDNPTRLKELDSSTTRMCGFDWSVVQLPSTNFHICCMHHAHAWAHINIMQALFEMQSTRKMLKTEVLPK